MYVNSPGTERESYSLTFLGKKVGRHHTVAPTGKQLAWETSTTSTAPIEHVVTSEAAQLPLPVHEDLPGSVPELNLHQDNTAAIVHHKPLWMKRWDVFKRWIGNNNEEEAQQQQSTNEGESSRTEKSEDVRIYIPYESAELCVTQIAKDIVEIKKRHQEKMEELEEHFLLTTQRNQECIVQKVRAHYRDRLHAVQRILVVYQQRVEKEKLELEKKIVDLTNQNEQILENSKAERKRSKEEAIQWHREKSKMMELFSNRLDALHSQQSSTLQELQMAREEIVHIQEMLISSNDQCETLREAESAEKREQLNQFCSDSNQPLEGAKARLEELKESLYQKEREITELLEAKSSSIPPVSQPPCSALLPVVIHKAHTICCTVTETRYLLDQMIEDSQVALQNARVKLNSLQMANKGNDGNRDKNGSDIRSDGYKSSLTLLEQTVKDCEVHYIALDSIRGGKSPAMMNDCSISDLEDMLGQGPLQCQEGVTSVGQQLLLLQTQLKQEKEEKKKIIENYTSERTMRKKYYNMVEDMKGKIRVFCRIRPVNRNEAAHGGATVVDKIDDYSVSVESSRGPKEFLFDKVFSAEASQEELFHDTNRLIQSTIDGYNVCIFAYGQTGSGKTYTMVGDKEQKNLGLIPRSFTALFDIMLENSSKFDFKVSTYILELYNDRLQDLFVCPDGEAHSHSHARRVELKRNRKGVVFAQGAETKEASSAQELYALFQQACANRHISITKMNTESSRSHLIVSIMVESRNLTNGSVSTGKLSLVDLAGSERAAKTGAKDHQLKEANSINKSLSALGDVFSALSSDLPHVPYRNNKLTQVMQDSLGGNAKTLMIVNISPSECNLDETLTSLMYATRVKAITNSAQKSVESKEITQLKEVIMRLKSGQTVEEEDV